MIDFSGRLFSLGSAGMRGVIGPGLTPGAAGDFAAAFATWCGSGPILVGLDPRGSSEMLRDAVISTLSACGCASVDGGVLTAGMMHCLIPAHQFAGGILITGGHQGSGWNALIPLAADGSYFDTLRQRELFDLYLGKTFPYASADSIGETRQLAIQDQEPYWRFLKENLKCDAIRNADFTVIADFCNGAGAAHAERFAKLLGIRLIGVNNIVSAAIPRDPEPRPRSESTITSLMKPLNAAIGLVFNRDASRLGVVSNIGEPLSEELTFPLAVDYLLRHAQPGSLIVTNICSTRTLDEVVARHKGILHKCKVGQANVIDTMRSTGAIAGGEGSGGFTIGGLRGFDGFLMAGLLLEAAAIRKKTVAELVSELPRYHIVKKGIPCDSPHGYRLLHQMRHELGDDAEITEEDGLRFDWSDGFLSLRFSKTEMTLRLISESAQRELAEERAWRARTVWERLTR